MSDKSYEEQVAEAKARIAEVTPREAMARQGEAVFLDVRRPEEWNLFRIPNAVWVPLDQLDEGIAERIPRDREVVVYCARGNRSALAADMMREMGYERVASMSQGIVGWANAGGEVEQ